MRIKWEALGLALYFAFCVVIGFVKAPAWLNIVHWIVLVWVLVRLFWEVLWGWFKALWQLLMSFAK